MRELTVRIKFTKPCLGNVKRYSVDTVSGRRWPYFVMPRTPSGQVRFEARWWRASLQFAANVLCAHQKAVREIRFDIAVDGSPSPELRSFYKRYFDAKRFVKHEAFHEGEIVGVNCVVPSSISDDDLWRLMDIVGRFRGISPFGPQEYGFFTVVSITRKHLPIPEPVEYVRDKDCQNLQGRESNTPAANRPAD